MATAAPSQHLSHVARHAISSKCPVQGITLFVRERERGRHMIRTPFLFDTHLRTLYACTRIIPNQEQGPPCFRAHVAPRRFWLREKRQSRIVDRWSQCGAEAFRAASSPKSLTGKAGPFLRLCGEVWSLGNHTEECCPYSTLSPRSRKTRPQRA